MSHKPTYIRPIAIGIIRNGTMILVGEGYDTKKPETFYRPLGGSIEFGERAEDTLRRELMEEIRADISDTHFTGVLENVFTYEGEEMHEIIFVYEANLMKRELYDAQVIDVNENGNAQKAYWKELEDFRSRKLILYPEGLTELISKTAKTH